MQQQQDELSKESAKKDQQIAHFTGVMAKVDNQVALLKDQF
jgi:hypothetical protein